MDNAARLHRLLGFGGVGTGFVGFRKHGGTNLKRGVGCGGGTNLNFMMLFGGISRDSKIVPFARDIFLNFSFFSIAFVFIVVFRTL